MHPSTTVIRLSVLIALLALVATGAGLLWPAESAPFSFSTLRGEQVSIYGQGLYRYDTLLIGAGYKGVDLVTLVLCVPLLVISLLYYRRGSGRGALLLLGALAYFLYDYASLAMGAAYNSLFLVYLVLFSASLFAFAGLFVALLTPDLPAHFSPALPRRAIAIFLFVAGTAHLAVWFGLSLLPALLQGKPPAELASYTTLITHVLDLGVIMPAEFLGGILLLRRAPLGYLLAATILVLAWTIGTTVLAASVVQLQAGALTFGQVLGFSVPFVLLDLAGIWLTVRFVRSYTGGTA
jgi:hypothetical protein